MFFDAHGLIVEFDLLDDARCGQGILQMMTTVGAMIQAMRMNFHGLRREGGPGMERMLRLAAASPLR
jgi:hypothetical protein